MHDGMSENHSDNKEIIVNIHVNDNVKPMETPTIIETELLRNPPPRPQQVSHTPRNIAGFGQRYVAPPKKSDCEKCCDCVEENCGTSLFVCFYLCIFAIFCLTTILSFALDPPYNKRIHNAACHVNHTKYEKVNNNYIGTLDVNVMAIWDTDYVNKNETFIIKNKCQKINVADCSQAGVSPDCYVLYHKSKIQKVSFDPIDKQTYDPTLFYIWLTCLILLGLLWLCIIVGK